MAAVTYNVDSGRKLHRLRDDLRILEKHGRSGRKEASYLFLVRVQDHSVREEVRKLPNVMRLISQYASDENAAVACNFLRVFLALGRSDMSFTRRATVASFPTFAPAEPQERKRHRHETVFFGTSLRDRLAIFSSRARLLPHGRSDFDRRRLQVLNTSETFASLMRCLDRYRKACESSTVALTANFEEE